MLQLAILVYQPYAKRANILMRIELLCCYADVIFGKYGI
jgi:hypothetical protein